MSAEIRSYLVAIISVKQESAGVFKFPPRKKKQKTSAKSTSTVFLDGPGVVAYGDECQ